MNATFALITRVSVLYTGLVLLGGWISLSFRRIDNHAWRPSAAFFGVVVAQLVGWHWSATVDRGLFELWRPLFLVTTSATCLAVFAMRHALLQLVRDTSQWGAQLWASILSLALFALYAHPLLGRSTLSISMQNNDVAAYAAVARHISNWGFSSAGTIYGANLGHVARTDVYGMYNLLSFGRWITGNEVFELAMAMSAVLCIFLAQTIVAFLRRYTTLRPPVLVIVALIPQSTFLFTYIADCYFAAQLLGMSIAIGVITVLLQTRESGTRITLISWISLTAMFISLTMTYPHMLFLFTPTAVLIAAISRKWRFWVTLKVVALPGVAWVLAAALVPDRMTVALERTFFLARVDAGWPLPGVLPLGLIGFQSSWNHTVNIWTICGSVLLVAATSIAVRSLRRQVPEWSLPALGILFVTLSSYALLYFGRGGPTYQQWKWISFFQPLACVACIAPIAAWMTRRHTTAATSVTALTLTTLLGVNMLASASYRRSVLTSNWVSPELGRIGEDPSLSDVASVNVDLAPYWESMWAADALSPRMVYVLQPSYYGVARPTASWTLTSRSKLPTNSTSDQARTVGTTYALIRTDILPR